MMRRDRIDESSNIGIGAMIIFISSILLAALILASIIQIAEKLVQAPEKTGSEALRSSTDRMIVREVYVWDDFDNFGFVWELSRGSADHEREEIYWIMQCTDENGAFWRFWGTFVDGVGEALDNPTKEYPWTAAGAQITTFTTGVIYESSIDQANGNAGAPANQPAPNAETCGPSHLFDHQLTTEMWFIIGGGGTTYLSLEVHDDSVGARIV